ncbi:MAG: hypothetical protein JXD23_04165 [Spirochaetales bacterium]|nr:hypothetical protein [Spirochaetales bacterium]
MSLAADGDKAGAERLLTYCLVAFGVMIFFCGRVLAYGRRAARKFDKILDAAKLKGQLPLDRLDYFGKFGANMRRLYEELHALGERKSNRIQQQNLTINKLLEFIGAPLLVMDAGGEVRKASGGFCEKHKISAAQAVGTQVRGYVEDLDFREILLQANRTKGPVEVKSGKTPLTFYPVLSIDNDVSYFIVAFGPHELKGFVSEPAKGRAPQAGPERRKFLGGLVDIIRKRLTPGKKPENGKR